ncbi:MAG: pyrroloquinoline quinone biosynthesis protein PqqE [Proteobacteria bacterium]|nr:pyrroloquinoline quinone biosynthesis protein PqqE [Pseudomonadota bacterium]
MTAPRPYNLVAELTYRCPLRCPYCSNPVDGLGERDALSADDWSRVFGEAAELGVLHVGLTGGEPAARADLESIVAGAAAAGLYSHLVTAGAGRAIERLAGLQRAGLRSVQLSLQDSREETADRIAGTRSFADKLAFARHVRELGLPLVLNCVLHRENLARVPELVALARELDAERLELANVQFHGWARLNRAALMPEREALAAAAEQVRRARRESARPELVFVLPDHHADRPKPCMGGWGRKTIVVTPGGRVQPCHEAGTLPGLEFWNVKERGLAACWERAPGMNAFRGEAWMPEPCRSCDRREQDFGGCRCQAFHLTGDAAKTDPACALAPDHARIEGLRTPPPTGAEWVYRELRRDPPRNRA